MENAGSEFLTSGGVVRLAHYCAYPLKYACKDMRLVTGLEEHVGDTLLEDAHFGHFLMQFVDKNRSVEQLDISTKFLESLEINRKNRLPVEIALAPIELIMQACKHLAAAIFTKILSGMVLKQVRQNYEQVIGADAMITGTRQSQMFYPALAQLAPGVEQLKKIDLLTRQSEQVEIDRHTGLAKMCRPLREMPLLLLYPFLLIGEMLQRTQSFLGEIFQRRFGLYAVKRNSIPAFGDTPLLSDAQIEQSFNLCSKKVLSWSTSTA